MGAKRNWEAQERKHPNVFPLQVSNRVKKWSGYREMVRSIVWWKFYLKHFFCFFLVVEPLRMLLASDTSRQFFCFFLINTGVLRQICWMDPEHVVFVNVFSNCVSGSAPRWIVLLLKPSLVKFSFLPLQIWRRGKNQTLNIQWKITNKIQKWRN